MATAKRYTLIIVAILILIVTGVSARLYQLTRIKFDIDLMTDDLKPIKQHLGRTTHIGFDTDIPSDGLYNEAAFIMAPVVITKDADKDTILYLQSKGTTLKAFLGYHVIAKSLSGQYQFILLQKDK